MKGVVPTLPKSLLGRPPPDPAEPGLPSHYERNESTVAIFVTGAGGASRRRAEILILCSRLSHYNVM